jgi:hypothetical protein
MGSNHVGDLLSLNGEIKDGHNSTVPGLSPNPFSSKAFFCCLFPPKLFERYKSYHDGSS